MSKEKLSAAHIEEQIKRDEVMPHKGLRKYKREKDEEGGLKEGTEIFIGARVVMRVNYHNSTKGYILAKVIDFLDDNRSFWGREDDVVVQIELASQPQVENLVGRYRIGSVSPYGWGRRFEIVAVGASNWRNYLVKT